jgi:curved DNA-binding protein CbpA
MVEAKKRYRKLSARYHPDKTGGDERLTAQYRAVQESWKTIEQWNEENRS